MGVVDLLMPRMQKVFSDELDRLGVKVDEGRVILFGDGEDEHVVYVRYSVPVCTIGHDVLMAAYKEDRWGDIDDFVRAAALLAAQEVARSPNKISEQFAKSLFEDKK